MDRVGKATRGERPENEDRPRPNVIGCPDARLPWRAVPISLADGGPFPLVVFRLMHTVACWAQSSAVTTAGSVHTSRVKVRMNPNEVGIDCRYRVIVAQRVGGPPFFT
jgi:hypothetical protein